MISIHFEAETISDVQHDMKKLLEGMGGKIAAAAFDEIPSGIHVEQSSKPNKGDRSEPKLEDAAADGTAEPAPIDATVERVDEARGPKEDRPQPTMEQTRAALNTLRAKKGPKAVRVILTSHNVSSFTDLKPDEYAAVITEVEKELKEESADAAD